MASIENKGARASIHTMKALKNVLTACQLSAHLANHALELLDFTFLHVKTIGECWIKELVKSVNG